MRKITLIADATAELNFRTRGRDARLARLAAGGVPVDRDALRVWLEAALDAELESNGGLYLCGTCRTHHGVDAELPQRNKIGCKITRVPLHATLGGPTDSPLDDERHEAPSDSRWFVDERYLVNAEDAATAAEAEAVVRARLLKKGCCATTRLEAVLMVTAMLERRTRRRVSRSASRTAKEQRP